MLLRLVKSFPQKRQSWLPVWPELRRRRPPGGEHGWACEASAAWGGIGTPVGKTSSCGGEEATTPASGYDAFMIISVDFTCKVKEHPVSAKRY